MKFAIFAAFAGGPDWVITARHDGYARRFGVEHERTLRRVDGGFAIEDRLIGRPPGLAATGRLLVGPTCTASMAAPDTVVVDDGRSVKLYPGLPQFFVSGAGEIELAPHRRVGLGKGLDRVEYA